MLNKLCLTLASAATAIVLIAGTANAGPTLDFDVDGPGSSASVFNIGGLCIGCFAFTTLAPGLGSEIFSLAEGDSYMFDFFDITVGGFIAAATADATATLAFDLPPGSSVVATGSGGFATFLGVLSAGSLTWDSSVPAEIMLSNGSKFEVDLTDIHAFGIGNTATVKAIITATRVVPEPGTLALFGLGLAGLGFARRRKAA